MSNNINTTEAAAADPMVDELAIAVSGGTLSNIKLDSESQIMVIGVGGAGGNTVDHIHLHKGFFPGCTGGAEHITPVKEEGPGHTEDKAENKRYQEVITGKPPQALQPPKNQIINAQIHQGAGKTDDRKLQIRHFFNMFIPKTGEEGFVLGNHLGSWDLMARYRMKNDDELYDLITSKSEYVKRRIGEKGCSL